MTTWQIVEADVMDWCREYDGEPFHAILSDPPFSLKFMSKKWDDDIAFRPETWAALSEHLLPGAWTMAFASSRGWHRLACALEDSGMVIQPSIFVEGVGLVDCAGILGFATGQAFPKASRIDTRIDAEAGMERETIGRNPYASRRPNPMAGSVYNYNAARYDPSQGLDITAPATALAAAWEGHRYGGQVIKDVLSPIVCAQKPWTGKRLEAIVATGAGALNVDAGRLVTSDCLGRPLSQESKNGPIAFQASPSGAGSITDEWKRGRWPASLCLTHHELCHPVTETVPCPDCGGDGRRDTCGTCGGSGQVERETVSRVKSANSPANLAPTNAHGQVYGLKDYAALHKSGAHYGDTNGLEPVTRYTCARYCSSCDRLWTAEEAEPCTCGGEGEWACSVRRMGEQSGVSPSNARKNKAGGCKFFLGGDKREYAPWSCNDKGTAARFYLNPDFTLESIESEFWADTAERLATGRPVFYTGKASRRERDAGLDDSFPLSAPPASARSKPAPGRKNALGEPRHNGHPCVKPLSLCVWLNRLLAPPPEYAPRRLLIPFCGTFSEGIGAILSDGFEEIVGIDSNAEYCALAESRARFWHGWHERTGSAEPKRVLAAARKAPAAMRVQAPLLLEVP